MRFLLSIGVLAGVISLSVPTVADEDVLSAAAEMIARGSADEAVASLTKYVTAHPKSADGQRLLGISLALIPRRSAALEALQRAVKLGPKDPANRMAFGQALSKFGDNSGARREFEATLDLDPRSPAAHEGLALALAFDGALDIAVKHFSSALEYAPENPRWKARLHYLRGRAWNQLEKLDEAAKDFDAALQLDPALGPAYLELGRILSERNGERTVSVLEKAVQLLPGSFEAHATLGNHYLRAGRAEAALAPLRRATELDPSDRAAAYALGRALREAGREEEATAYLRQLSQSAGGRATSEADINEAGRVNNQALELEKRGEYEQALGKYREAIAIAPGEIGFRRNAALALCRLNRWDEAKVALREVLRLSPGDVDATKALYLALEHAPDKP